MDRETREQAARGEYTREVAHYSIGSDHWPGLAKVIEEMGELQTVLTKIMSTGGETEYWDGTDLRLRLVEELADTEAAIWFFTVANRIVQWPEFMEYYQQRVRQKQDRYTEWHFVQRKP